MRIEDGGPGESRTSNGTAAPEPRPPRAARWMYFLARVTSGLWAGFWVFFFVASTAAEIESRGVTPSVLLVPASLTLLLIALALTAWIWTGVGRIALTITGLAVLAGYPFVAGNLPLSTKIFTTATLGLPPLSAGLLLIIAGPTGRGGATGSGVEA